MAGMNVRTDILDQKPKPSGRDLAYRAVAAVLGGPVDLTSMVMKPFGYDTEKPVLGSEWIGQQMQDVGLVSEARDPMQEFMASLLVPGGGIEAVPALAGKGMAMLPAALGVVKAKGGNWLTGSAEDALRPLKKPTFSLEGFTDAESVAESRYMDQVSRPLNSWVEGPLTKYVKTRMASPDDEIRKLADQGVLHVDPATLLHGGRTIPMSGAAPTKLAVSDEAKRWENATDYSIGTETAGLYKLTRGQDGTTTLSRNPWLEGVPNDTVVHDFTPDASAESLGFRHLTDELSNALNPESGLPRALQLTPDQMKNLSVEKAVRRVADINKWRANQMAEANKAIAFDEKTAPVFKEYQTVPGYGGGQPNEKGLHWREIKQPELPEGWSKRKDALGVDVVGTPDGYITRAGSLKDPRRESLEKQLKYEGDTMGHCVGGYCDAVLSGRSQVYTLRDKAGKPHVTIEVAPPGEGAHTLEQYKTAFINAGMSGSDADTWYRGSSALPPEVADQLARDIGNGRIVQIKGSKNSAPKDDYVPFIQDFIRNGNFSDIGDLKNAQMVKASQTFNKTELEYLKNHGAELKGEEYLTKAEVEALQSLFKPAN
jgi:hypothetical protein